MYILIVWIRHSNSFSAPSALPKYVIEWHHFYYKYYLIIIIIIIILLFWEFLHQCKLMVSRMLLSILANLNNAVVWIVSTHPLISKSPSPCTNPLESLKDWYRDSETITIGITITYSYHNFFSSLAWFRYLSLFLLLFNFIILSILHH